jgi:membrane protein required for colicin V production
MIVDLLVLAALLISAIIAFFRGFIREILTIGAFVGGALAAYVGGPLLSPLMSQWIGVPDPLPEGQKMPHLFDIVPYDILADALSYGALFIVVVIALSVLSHFTAEAARSIGLGPIDRTLGFIFGVARAVLLLGILYLPVHFFIDQDTKEAWFQNSKTHFYVETVSKTIAHYIPNSTVEDVQGNIDKAEELDQTRKKLQEINLLKGNEALEQNGLTEPAPEKPKDTHGYDQEFRGQMNELFEQKTQNPDKPRKLNE